MPDPVRMALFCEDDEHEQFVRAVVARMARELGLEVSIAGLSTRGGHGRALAELKAWQKALTAFGPGASPDLLIVVIDANCGKWSEAKRNIEARVDGAIITRTVIACPDPHIERWFLADPKAFEDVIGTPPGRDPEKCDRTFYKQLLADRIARGSEIPISGPAELARDLVAVMNLFQAGKNQPSLGHFISDLRSSLKQAMP